MKVANEGQPDRGPVLNASVIQAASLTKPSTTATVTVRNQDSSSIVASPPSQRRLKLALVGGPEVQLRLDLVRRLIRDFDICVLGSHQAGAAAFREVGADYRSYPMTRGISPWRDLITVIVLVRRFRSIRPDIVHAYDTKPCALGRLAAWIARVPVIIGTLPGMGSLYASNRLRITLVRWVYERVQKLACKISDLTILQNIEDLDDFVSRGIMPRSRTTIIHGSGVNTATFQPRKLPSEVASALRTSLGVGTGTLVVTMVSRIMRTKGVLEYALAASKVSQQYANAQFLLVGEDDQDSPDRLRPSELDFLKSSVRCVGRRSDVADVLSLTDVFALPSFSMEGIPRALLEAAASGLAIVTTNTRGCKDVVLDGISGILVAPKDSDALALAIQSLLGDPAKRRSLGHEARNRALKDFDVASISDKIGAVYKVLARKAGGKKTNVRPGG